MEFSVLMTAPWFRRKRLTGPMQTLQAVIQMPGQRDAGEIHHHTTSASPSDMAISPDEVVRIGATVVVDNDAGVWTACVADCQGHQMVSKQSALCGAGPPRLPSWS
jgi:hypothetical protein